MKKRIVAVLVCALVLALCVGCKNSARQLEGKWTASVDLRDALTADTAGISSFVIDVVFSFQKDGAYTMTFEKASVEAAVDKMIREREASVRQELEKQNPDMTAEALSAALEQLMAPMLEKKPELVQQITALSRSGRFRAADGKLWLSDGKASFDENTYDRYTLEGNTLTLTQHTGTAVQDSALYKILYPLVLRRTN